MMKRTVGRSVAAVVAVAVATATTAVACADIDPPDPSGAVPSGGLAAVCPDPVVVQTPWWPQAEHGHLYRLLGPGYTVDAAAKRVTGPLVAGGEDTGATIEVRAGGPAVGRQLSIPLMYQDDSITLAAAHTDDQISLFGDTPALAVVAPLELHPRIIMWDPRTNPDWNTIVDIGDSDATVLYFEGSVYMEWLVGSGILRRDQIDASYDGQPARWVAEDGAVAQQGYATNEPYVYEHEVAQWGRPVEFELVHHRGYQMYADTITIRPDRKDELAPCLERLVPIIQRSMVDYVADPGPTNELIIELSEAYDSFPYSAGNAEFGVSEALRLGIIGNGDNGTIGDFDLERVAEALDQVRPVLAGLRVDVPGDLSAVDLVTNEFVDVSIGLP
jgi:hypothetical protein